MPTGVMRWFDPRTGEGVIEARGRELAVRARDVEARARVPGVRVRFDRVRDRGADRAVRVRLRGGTRTSRLQHRFGDLTGAHRPDAKGHRPSSDHPHVLEERPVEVVREWIRAVAGGDAQAAAALYAPDAVVHGSGISEAGPRAVRRWLETGGLLGATGMGVSVHPRDDVVVVTWPPNAEVVEPTVVQLRVGHGRIAEQWNTRPENRPRTAAIVTT